MGVSVGLGRVRVAVIEYISLVSGGRDFAVMALSGLGSSRSFLM